MLPPMLDSLLWLIPVLPLIGFLINSALGRRLGPPELRIPPAFATHGGHGHDHPPAHGTADHDVGPVHVTRDVHGGAHVHTMDAHGHGDDSTHDDHAGHRPTYHSPTHWVVAVIAVAGPLLSFVLSLMVVASIRAGAPPQRVYWQ